MLGHLKGIGFAFNVHFLGILGWLRLLVESFWLLIEFYFTVKNNSSPWDLLLLLIEPFHISNRTRRLRTWPLPTLLRDRSLRNWLILLMLKWTKQSLGGVLGASELFLLLVQDMWRPYIGDGLVDLDVIAFLRVHIWFIFDVAIGI